MCGRYSLQHTPEQIAERFEVIESTFQVEPRYNIAPSQTLAVVGATPNGRKLAGRKWGLVPFWAADPSVGNRMINAKAETLAEKPAFKYAIAKRRCLIPADGFYEWQKRKDGPNQPFYIRRRDRGLFAFAGLWEYWVSPEGEELRSCTIITVDPNELLRPLHDRMPAILAREHEAMWLDPSIKDPAVVRPLLDSYPGDELEFYPVARSVNSPAIDAPSLIEPLT